MTMTTMNLKISLSKNFNTVSAEFVEESIQYNGTDHGLHEAIAEKYELLQTAVQNRLEQVCKDQVRK